MNKYHILVPQSRGSFVEQVSELFDTINHLTTEIRQQGCHLQYAKVLLSDAQNQYKALTASSLYTQQLQPLALTIVQQPPLNGSKISILLKVTDEEDDFAFHSLRLKPAECHGQTSYVQALQLFGTYIKALEQLHLTMKDHCMRTWIYVADIDVNYAGVVKARNDVFRLQGLSTSTHFIASTGIGGYTQTREACVGIDFLTYPKAKAADIKFLQALDHLNPTHEYGVAFERGMRLRRPAGDTFYISGTASIDRYGQVMYEGDVMKQTDRLLENIQALLRDGGASLDDVQYFMVYLRDTGDYERVNAYMHHRFPHTPYLIVNAKVCRPHWLIEMECIARKER